MAKPVTFSRPAKTAKSGGTSFNFGANTKPRKSKGGTGRRSGGGGKGGGS